MNSFQRGAISQEQDLEECQRQGRDGDLQQKAVSTPSVQTLSEGPLTQSIEGMIQDLAIEVRSSFETSNSNQKEIRGLCEALGHKFDDLAIRTAALETEVSELKKATENNTEGFLKLELMKNNMRRNNLRFPKVPEGLEGGDLKSLVVRLIKPGVQIEDEEENLARDIQRVHRNPFRKPPNRVKPRKILVNFHTYAIKERILVAALNKKSLTAEGVNFEIRSDLSSVMLNKQWELGKIIDVLKRLGATAQLKFPASLRVMANNKMCMFSDVRDVDDLIKSMDKDYQMAA
ncbi:hypothetical protein NDU88_006113 [Pleurodeles waltl]|uniref:L1 transposable element RRM domain-containing protein n=1 Tax=Pleurodeles waltl TaxID=8319 RepID=A0AAV7WDR4_PLEWA|nr:hypothetical protein NDU88_006113 [Pleurodeles waltl]